MEVAVMILVLVLGAMCVFAVAFLAIGQPIWSIIDVSGSEGAES